MGFGPLVEEAGWAWPRGRWRASWALALAAQEAGHAGTVGDMVNTGEGAGELLLLVSEEQKQQHVHGDRKQKVTAADALFAGSRQIPRETSEGRRIQTRGVEAGASGGELGAVAGSMEVQVADGRNGAESARIQQRGDEQAAAMVVLSEWERDKTRKWSEKGRNNKKKMTTRRSGWPGLVDEGDSLGKARRRWTWSPEGALEREERRARGSERFAGPLLAGGWERAFRHERRRGWGWRGHSERRPDPRARPKSASSLT